MHAAHPFAHRVDDPSAADPRNFSIVLGELVPKRLGQLNPEAIARVVARPMHWLAAISKPCCLTCAS